MAPALATTGGVLWALCFQRVPLTWAAALALVPLLLLARHPRGALLAWTFGFAYWAVAIWWIAPTLEVFGSLPVPLAWMALAFLAALLGLYYAAFGWLVKRLWRVGGWALVLGAPAAWVVLEWGRGWLLTGFPWNLAAYAWMEMPGALPLASWVGAWGVAFVLVLVSSSIALAWTRRRWEIAAVGILAAASLLAAAARWAGPPPLPVAEAFTAVDRPVHIVQPNIPNMTFDGYDEREARANLRRLLDQSMDVCIPGALLIWPESAAWPFTPTTEPALGAGLDALTGNGCWVLVNTAIRARGRDYNSVVLYGPEGPEARYDKRQLVPYGEYVPLRRLFPFLGTVARAAGDFSAAETIRLLPWRGERLGAAICYEIVFPGQVAATVREGATVLVTVTNDAWYGDTSAPWQHFQAARFRAAETHRPMLRAAITGVSGWVTSAGVIQSRLGVDVEGVISGALAGRSHLTPFVRAPWAVPALSLALVIAALARAAKRPGARSQAHPPSDPRRPPPPPPDR